MILATIKQDILKQYNRLLNKKYIAALQYLLSPCCTISGTGVAVCKGINIFTLTITLDGPLPSFPIPYNIIVNTQGATTVLGTYNPTTHVITASGITFGTGGVTNVTENVGVEILYPTSADGSVGVYHSFTVPGVVFDGNSCN